MSICGYCERDMRKTDSCIEYDVEFADGVALKPLPFKPDEMFDTCPDCSVEEGGLHHPLCDCEVCPRCGGQFTSCDCGINKTKKPAEIMIMKLLSTVPSYVEKDEYGFIVKSDDERRVRYPIVWERCRTAEDILMWVCQLSGKNWTNGMSLRQFILAACEHNNIKIRWGGY